ncbi:unnamed protein product [Closterium sp. Naga37s-1]|nr:unnamed protein product [Closterium sp. Naga37s-1]
MAEAAGHTKAVAAPFSIALAPPHAAAAAAVPEPNFSAPNAAPIAGDIETPLIEPSRSLGDSMPAGTRVVRPWAGEGVGKKEITTAEDQLRSLHPPAAPPLDKSPSLASPFSPLHQIPYPLPAFPLSPLPQPVDRTRSGLFIRLPALQWDNPPVSSPPSTGLIPIAPFRPIPISPPAANPPYPFPILFPSSWRGPAPLPSSACLPCSGLIPPSPSPAFHSTGEDQLRPFHPHTAPLASQSGARLHGTTNPSRPSCLLSPLSAHLLSVCAAFTVRTIRIDGSQLLHTWQLFDWSIDTTIPTASIIRVSLCKLERRFSTTYFCRVTAADGKQLDFGGHLSKEECVWLQLEVSSFLLGLAAESV